LPILRPLIGFNKDEIIELAREIGTFAPSASVDEYCAILPRHPATRAGRDAIEAEESNLDPELLRRTLDSLSETDLRDLTLRYSEQESLAVQEVEKGAVLVDLRSRVAYEAWHYPDALHLDFFQALETFPSFDRDRAYVLYCEVGQKSAHLAELMRREGFRAFYLEEGAGRGLRRAAETGQLSL
jgi:thiamine biosynthesis protein ThiI